MSGSGVYFVQAGDNGPIKIGHSFDPENRMRQCAFWSPVPLRLLAKVPGGSQEEAALHEVFSAARLHGEWFQPVSGLLALIEFCVKHGRLPEAAITGRLALIIDRFSNGLTLKEIGHEVGLSSERVRQILAKQGLKRRLNNSLRKSPPQVYAWRKEDCMEQQQPKRPGPKGPRLKLDRSSPAYRIIYGLFTDRADFCRKTKTPHGTAHLWLTNGEIPASRRDAVIANAAAEGVTIPAEMFDRARAA